jgi:hypothetical protein
MTDLFLEDEPERRPEMLETLRAEARRLERRLHDTASGAVEDARLAVRRTQHRINSQLGLAALIAFGAGLAIGLIADLLSRRD